MSLLVFWDHCHGSVMSVAYLSTQHRRLCLGKPRVWVAACCKLLSRRNPTSTAQGAVCSHSASYIMSPEPQAVRQAPLPQLLSVAPMMEWTDLHFRQLVRMLSRHTWLYTEMVVDKTLLHNPLTDKFLWFPPEQHPIVCQLGGSNPATLGPAAAMAAQYGYDEINLNCGCPSDKVAGAGCFGASLMLQPQVVAECCQAMRAATGDVPITVKCRLGVDDADSYDELCSFVQTVSQQSGVRHFVIHSRKCLLRGLSPAQNRTVPKLKREWAWALKRDFPDLDISLNGEIEDCHQAAAALQHKAADGHIYGVMVGRSAYNRTWDCLSNADVCLFGAKSNPALSRRQVLQDYAQYGDAMVGRYGIRPDGTPSPNVRTLVKPLLNLFHGERGCKRWKQAVDSELRTAVSVSGLLEATLQHIPDEVLDAGPKQLFEPVQFSIGELPVRLQAESQPCDGLAQQGPAHPQTNSLQLPQQHYTSVAA